MAASIVLRFRSLAKFLEEELREENERLDALKEQMELQEQRLHHLAELREALSIAEEPLCFLERLPSMERQSPARPPRTSLLQGKATQLAFNVLRTAPHALSANEIAVETLAQAGFDHPDETEIKVVEAGLRKALNDQAEKGLIKQHNGSPVKFSVSRKDAESPPGETSGAGPSDAS